MTTTIETARERSIIGIDVSKDYLDIHILPVGRKLRLPNDRKGHAQVAKMAREMDAVVGFEATGGCERPLWARPGQEGDLGPPAAAGADQGLRDRHGVPHQDGSDRRDDDRRVHEGPPRRGSRAAVGRSPRSAGPCRLEGPVRFGLEEAENENAARERQGMDGKFDLVTDDYEAYLERQISSIDKEIQLIVGSDLTIHRTAVALRTVPGIGFVTAATLIAEMPELGMIPNRKIAALAGLAPFARDSGKKKGKRRIDGGRSCSRSILYQAAIVASRHNPVLRVFAQRLKDKGKPRKVVMIAVARKLVVIANALIRNGTVWDPKTKGSASADTVHSSDETAADESGSGQDREHGEAGSARKAAALEASGRRQSSRKPIGQDAGPDVEGRLTT